MYREEYRVDMLLEAVLVTKYMLGIGKRKNIPEPQKSYVR